MYNCDGRFSGPGESLGLCMCSGWVSPILRCAFLTVDQVGDLEIQGQIGLKVLRITCLHCASCIRIIHIGAACVSYIYSVAVVKSVPLRICRSDRGLPCAQTLPPLRRGASLKMRRRINSDGWFGDSDVFGRVCGIWWNQYRVHRDLVGTGRAAPPQRVENSLGAAAT